MHQKSSITMLWLNAQATRRRLEPLSGCRLMIGAGSTVLVSKRSEASAMVAAVLEAAATPGNRHEANKRRRAAHPPAAPI